MLKSTLIYLSCTYSASRQVYPSPSRHPPIIPSSTRQSAILLSVRAQLYFPSFLLSVNMWDHTCLSCQFHTDLSSMHLFCLPSILLSVSSVKSVSNRQICLSCQLPYHARLSVMSICEIIPVYSDITRPLWWDCVSILLSVINSTFRLNPTIADFYYPSSIPLTHVRLHDAMRWCTHSKISPQLL